MLLLCLSVLESKWCKVWSVKLASMQVACMRMLKCAAACVDGVRVSSLDEERNRDYEIKGC